jgi:hypothetical protein
MAHYALLDQNNITVSVITGRDDDSQADWEAFYSSETGYACKRTSYNTFGGVHRLGGTPFRKNYAGVGYKYDAQRDAFIPHKPYNSWVLNEQTCHWDAPVSYPNDGNRYRWDEDSMSWVSV